MSEALDKFRLFKSHHRKLVRYFAEGVVLAILLAILFLVGGRALSKLALDQLASMTNTKITDDSVDFNLDGSVEITNLQVKPDRESEHDQTILQADTVYARFGFGSILMLRPRLELVVVKDFIFNAQQDIDSGLWNVSEFELKGPGGKPGRIPEIHLQGGSLQYSKLEQGEIKVVAEMPVEARFGSDPSFDGGHRFEITTTEVAGVGRNLLKGTWRPGIFTINGGISSANIPAFGREWDADIIAGELKYDPNNAYAMKLSARGLATRGSLSGEIDTAPASAPKRGPGLFGALQWFFKRYRPLGVVDIDLERQGNFRQLDKDFKMNGTVSVKDALISDVKFPYMIDRLTGKIEFTEAGAVLDNLHGRHKQVELVINGKIEGFGTDLKSVFSIQSDKMLLDEDLYTALKLEHKRAWDDFSPTPQSLVAVNYRATRDKGKIEKVLEVDLLGTDARYRRFPYPLKNLNGRLTFSGGDIEVSDVVSQVGQRQIRINGDVRTGQDNKRKYDITIDAENAELDSVLLAALPEPQQKIYSQLGTSGLADAQVKIFTPSDSDSEAVFTANVSFKRASFEGREFPFLITDVFGQAVFTADSILIKSLEGRYGGGDVNLKGTAWPGQTMEDWGYKLELGANKIELSEDFIASFPQWLGMNIGKLQPEGRINFTAKLNKEMGTEPDYAIDLECLGNNFNLEYFPYPLRDVRGRMELTSSEIRLTNLTGRPAGLQIQDEAGTVEVSGLVLLSEQTWDRMGFMIQASDIWFDERFGNALPGKVHSSYQRFSPTGRFDLHDMRIRLTNGGQNGTDVDFEGDVTFKECGVETFATISDFNGRLQNIEVSYNTNSGFKNAAAVLDTDSFRIRGALLKDAQAQILYNESEQKWYSEKIVGDLYGGGLLANFELKKSPYTGWIYTLDTGFDNVDLERFLEDVAFYGRQLDAKAYEAIHGLSPKQQVDAQREYTKGLLGGSLCIEERLGEPGSNSGRIRLSVRDMEVGRLSPIAKLLLVLDITDQKDFAFEKMMVDSYIDTDIIDLDKFDLSGNTVAFTGSGKLDLKSRQVDLKLTARGERVAGTEPGVLESLTEGLGSGIVRMDVKGDIYDPEVTTMTLPVLEATLGIFGTPESDASQ